VLGRPKGDSRLLYDFRPPNLPQISWRATRDISAEVFSISKPSMGVTRGNTNVHSRTSHTMITMMIMIRLICCSYFTTRSHVSVPCGFLVAPLARCEVRLNQSGCRVSLCVFHCFCLSVCLCVEIFFPNNPPPAQRRDNLPLGILVF